MVRLKGNGITFLASLLSSSFPPPFLPCLSFAPVLFVSMSSGPEFEGRIRLNEANNPKFNFLNFGDPYHAYYQHKIKEIKEGVSKY